MVAYIGLRDAPDSVTGMRSGACMIAKRDSAFVPGACKRVEDEFITHLKRAKEGYRIP